MMFFIHEEFATFKSKYIWLFFLFFYVLYKENGSRQFNVPEISGRVYRTIRRCHRPGSSTPFWVKQSAYDGFIVYVCVSVDYLH
jgi:hypothetical protein